LYFEPEPEPEPAPAPAPAPTTTTTGGGGTTLHPCEIDPFDPRCGDPPPDGTSCSSMPSWCGCGSTYEGCFDNKHGTYKDCTCAGTPVTCVVSVANDCDDLNIACTDFGQTITGVCGFSLGTWGCSTSGTCNAGCCGSLTTCKAGGGKTVATCDGTLCVKEELSCDTGCCDELDISCDADGTVYDKSCVAPPIGPLICADTNPSCTDACCQTSGAGDFCGGNGCYFKECDPPAQGCFQGQVCNDRGRCVCEAGFWDCNNNAADGCEDTTGPVDGSWSGWSSCSPSCGDGTQTRTCQGRFCGGSGCSGPSSQSCNNGPCCVDNDGDGYGNPGNAACPNGGATDCNDGNPNINPGAAENTVASCSDGFDNNCNSVIDCSETSCAGSLSGNVQNTNNENVSGARIDVILGATAQHTEFTNTLGNYQTQNPVLCGNYNIVLWLR